MPQWQYRVIYINDAPRGSDAIDMLNDAGGEGWELIAITAKQRRVHEAPDRGVRAELPAA